ncbi:cold-shock protein [Roseateles sp.]|uniref:cold-shock protein n=1 Tax=Roseateles sp. TaxID=1971397 RepID=UPI00286AD483|nr:cold shock domain-containing protein [Roseateles sp.]
MRFEGILTVWHIDRGYGSVMPDQGGQELFIHVSAFPAEGPQPLAGEHISFEIVTGRNQQKQAVRALRLKTGPALAAAKAPGRVHGRRSALKAQRPVLAYVLVGVAVAAGLASWLWCNPGAAPRMARLASTHADFFQSVCLPQGSEAALRSAPLRSTPLRVRSTASKA